MVGDASADLLDEIGVLTLGVAHQVPFGLLFFIRRYCGRQNIEGLADRVDVVVVDCTLLDGGR